jgi:hypothetical protein
MTRRGLQLRVARTALLLGLALTACTGGVGDRSPGAVAGSPTQPSRPATAPAGASDGSDTTWNGLAGPLGRTLTFDSGLAVRVAPPVRWPGASSGTGDPGRTMFTVAVTVANGQSTPFDATGLTADATVGATGTPCTKAQDGTRALWRPVPASVPAGGTGRLTLGYSCPGGSGQTLLVEVAPEAGFAGAQFTGSLP